MSRRPLVSIKVPPGENERTVWMRHQIAALSEGCCPYCAGRMEPADTEHGPGSRCLAGCGRFWTGPSWLDPTDTIVSWWREFDPRTGGPLL